MPYLLTLEKNDFRDGDMNFVKKKQQQKKHGVPWVACHLY